VPFCFSEEPFAESFVLGLKIARGPINKVALFLILWTTGMTNAMTRGVLIAV